jgi:hypothetical protein
MPSQRARTIVRAREPKETAATYVGTRPPQMGGIFSKHFATGRRMVRFAAVWERLPSKKTGPHAGRLLPLCAHHSWPRPCASADGARDAAPGTGLRRRWPRSCGRCPTRPPLRWLARTTLAPAGGGARDADRTRAVGLAFSDPQPCDESQPWRYLVGAAHCAPSVPPGVDRPIWLARKAIGRLPPSIGATDIETGDKSGPMTRKEKGL